MARCLQKALEGLLVELDITGHALAVRADVNHQTFYTWLNGKATPPRRQAERLAEALKHPELVDLAERDRDRNRQRRRRAKRAASAT